MKNDILKAIEDFVDIIYTPDQSNLNNSFINVIDQLSLYITEQQSRNNILDMNKELVEMQNAFIDKDYTLLSDILLYKIKSLILALEELE